MHDTVNFYGVWMDFLDKIPSIALMVAIYFIGHNAWKKSALKEVEHWCKENNLEIYPNHSAVFKMGRPAHVEQLVLENGCIYLCDFALYGGIFALPQSFTRTWGKVRLVSKVCVSNEGEAPTP